MVDVDGLNPEQRQAVQHRLGHLLILAGAGTGKTRTLVHRLASLLDEGVPPWKLLAITFTNRAAAELRERLRHLVGEAADEVVCGTFHSVSARGLRRRGDRIGCRQDFIIYDEGDQRSVATSLLSAGDQLTPGALIKAMERHRLYPDLVTPTWDRAATTAKQRLGEYREALNRAGAIDFMGLIEGGAALAGGGHMPRFHEVMVDEFQDTDALQHRFLEGLVKHGARLVAVGDDDQAIYGWRGADVRGMLRFEQQYDGASRVTLARNYRSRQRILDAANRLIANNKERLGKALAGVRGEGEMVEVLGVADDRAEGRAVTRQLKCWLDAGLPGPELAVLARTNALLRGIEIHIAGAAIPYRLVGGRALFETREVRDVCAFLRLWVQPDSDLDLLRIINRPTRGMGKKAVDTVRAAAGSQAILPFLLRREHVFPARIQRGVDQLLALLEPRPETATEAVQRVLDEGGYLDWVRGREPERAEEREGNLMALLDSVRTIAGDRGDLATFLEGWSLAGGAELGRGSGVRLMTIHASKGLEFSGVLLPGWEQGMFPMPDPEGQRFDQFEEERRLAYVALTRAKDHAVISWARSRMHHGRTLPGRPSPFIAELGGPGVAGYAHHPLDGRHATALPRPRVAAGPVVAVFDELAQADYGELEGGVFTPGDTVQHGRFGRGVIQSLRGSGETANVVVRFGDGSSRTIRAAYLQPAQESW